MLFNLPTLQPLTVSLHKQSEALLELEKACRSCPRLEGLCRDFELQKVCYIPLNVFILRPLHRLVHYKQILERLCKHYPATHVDFRDCRGTTIMAAGDGSRSSHRNVNRSTSCSKETLKALHVHQWMFIFQHKVNLRKCSCPLWVCSCCGCRAKTCSSSSVGAALLP